MAKARLVKRSAVIEQEKAQAKAPTGSLSKSVESVREWINQHQTRRPMDARQAFATLFAQPQKA
jgi:hypothetical protein